MKNEYKNYCFRTASGDSYASYWKNASRSNERIGIRVRGITNSKTGFFRKVGPGYNKRTISNSNEIHLVCLMRIKHGAFILDLLFPFLFPQFLFKCFGQ